VALLLPTHFLYAFLYYTDMGAVTFLLASYLVGTLCLQSSEVIVLTQSCMHEYHGALQRPNAMMVVNLIRRIRECVS